MLTPVDVQNKVFKGGIGFDKKDVEAFMSELASDYGELYRSNVELKDKVAALDESLQHYRSIEDSMQKALTLSEKTAEETIIAANDKARQINTEAEKKAEMLLSDAQTELQETKEEIFRLQKQHAKFKEQFTKILNAQLQAMDGEVVDIDLGDFESSRYSEGGGFGSFGGGLGSEGGLGGLGGGGGYTGASSFDDGRERAAGEPTINRTSLNTDPFADAANGGGRFSRQTGGSYNGSSSGKKSSSQSSSNKSSLNMKANAGSAKTKKQATENTVPNKEKVQMSSNTAPVKKSAETVSQPAPQPAPQPSVTEQVQVEGEVETKINESNMLDSEDNYSSGFDFVSDETAATQTVDTTDTPITGEVEVPVNESNMLDSEDNYNTGFDFVSDEADETPSYQSASDSEEETAYAGEVEIPVNESNMIDSEDNYNDGFDFVVGDEDSEEEIPTITPDFSTGVTGSTGLDGASLNGAGLGGGLGSTEGSSGASLHIDPFAEEEDVFVGDVEDNVNQSNLIGNADDDEEGFNFL